MRTPIFASLVVLFRIQTEAAAAAKEEAEALGTWRHLLIPTKRRLNASD